MSRRIGIAVPVGKGMVDAWFMQDMVIAVSRHAYTHPEDDIVFTHTEGALIQQSRNLLCRELLDAGVDYLICVDDDMRFPQDMIERLVAHDLPVVAANCAKRRRPISATARKEREGDPSTLDVIWPDPEKRGLEQAHVAGAAVMCIKREVLEHVPHPWFDTPYLADKDAWRGEDVYFCAQLKKHGIPLYIDHGLSWEVGHIGTYVYESKDILVERQLAADGHWNQMPEGKAFHAAQLAK